MGGMASRALRLSRHLRPENAPMDTTPQERLGTLSRLQDDLLHRLAKDRSGTELQLIHQLEEIWLHEKGSEARNLILAAISVVGSALQEGEDFPAEGKQKMERAETMFRKLREQYPSWSEPCFKLSEVAYLQGDIVSSKNFCRQALLLKPKHVGALIGLATAQLILDETNEAFEVLEMLSKVHPASADRIAKRAYALIVRRAR